jgi:hypothetical protein
MLVVPPVTRRVGAISPLPSTGNALKASAVSSTTMSSCAAGAKAMDTGRPNSVLAPLIILLAVTFVPLSSML